MTTKSTHEKILMGNEAIGLGLVENGCTVITSYPGTPASEIISSVARFKNEHDLKLHVEWSVNEKSAYEVALSNSYMGCRSAVAMKQVGLNVASDPLMSSAYTGIIGGFVLVSADDPGPHSSQTEQDSRLMAMLAKIPVFDPSSPQEAYQMVKTAVTLSEKNGIPVMIRPTTRICHARQNVKTGTIQKLKRKATFSKDPQRWAATPKYRFKLHGELNKKLAQISATKNLQPERVNKRKKAPKHCILSSGVAYSYVYDMMKDAELLDQAALYKVPMPFPLSQDFLQDLCNSYEHILVIEETYPVIEMQLPDRTNVQGKINGFIPPEGELTPDVIYPALNTFLERKTGKIPKAKPGGQRPSLCAGCPHRASYYCIKKALPKAVYPGDIGCYTLGVNLGAVDTCLCMGASINQAAGFYHSFKTSGSEAKTVVATIGDSTFIHSGITALINAKYNDARFILMILDNSTTAMTGNQPTALTGVMADGSPGNSVDLHGILKGCGMQFVKTVDPFDIEKMIATLKEAEKFTRASDGGIAVIIAKRPCLMISEKKKVYSVSVSEACTGCNYCITNFECPALITVKDRAAIDQLSCSGCGVCVHVCPIKAIEIER